MTTDSAPGWVLVMPVKAGPTAKSRITDLTPELRRALALAFALDTAAAALVTDGVDAVLAVVDDPVAAGRLHGLGCAVVADEPRAGLNPAVQHGTDTARHRWQDCRVGVLPSDLPALRAVDLARALAAARQHPRAFVSDAARIGTNLLTAAPGVALNPRFEGLSCRAHAASGAAELDGAVPSIRCDVDRRADLDHARTLGVGPATASVLTEATAGCSLR